MKQDVIIATVKNYGWTEMMAFVVSIEKSGYSGLKVMFVENITVDARTRLLSKNWTLVDVVADVSQSYATARHIPVVSYLKENADNLRYVLYIDVRDAVVQSDPTPWLEQNLSPSTSIEIIGPSECVPIKVQTDNARWIEATMGGIVLSWLGEYDVLCCGTIIGTVSAVIYCVEKMCEMSSNISGWGYDQAYFNYLLRVSPLKEITREVRTSDGFIVTCSWYLHAPEFWAPYVNDAAPRFDRVDGVAYAPESGGGVVYPILHQYDRDGNFAVPVQGRYSK